MNYEKMNKDSNVSQTEAEHHLLRQILSTLNNEQKRKVAKRLEKERAHFERTSTLGHEVFYEVKLATCAAFERLTKN